MVLTKHPIYVYCIKIPLLQTHAYCRQQNAGSSSQHMRCLWLLCVCYTNGYSFALKTINIFLDYNVQYMCDGNVACFAFALQSFLGLSTQIKNQ